MVNSRFCKSTIFFKYYDKVMKLVAFRTETICLYRRLFMSVDGMFFFINQAMKIFVCRQFLQNIHLPFADKFSSCWSELTDSL